MVKWRIRLLFSSLAAVAFAGFGAQTYFHSF